MLPNSDVTHRSTKKSTTKKLKRKNENVGDANNKNRRSRRRDSKSLVLAFLASFVFFSMIYFLFIRPKISYNGLDSERYARGKALRNAALLSMSQGDSNGIDSSSNGSSNKKVRGGKQLKQKENIGGMRYLDPRQLPPLPGEPSEPYDGHGKKHGFRGDGDDEWQADSKSNPRQLPAPNVDYTKHTYQYPEVMYEPPNDGTYPPLQKMSTIFETWGQDDLDSPPDTIVEVLQHFDFQDPDQLKVRQFKTHYFVH